MKRDVAIDGPSGASSAVRTAIDPMPWLNGVVVILAGATVAAAVMFDVWLYAALAIGGFMFVVAALNKPYLGLLAWMFSFPILDPYVRLNLPAGIPDITLNRVATGLVVLTLMLDVMLRRRRLLPIGPIERCMLMLSAMMAVDIYMRSASVGEDVLLFFDEFLTPFLLFVAFKNLVGHGIDVRKALIALALSALYLAPHGAYQFIMRSEVPFFIGPPESVHSLVEEQGRARGPFTDSISYGSLGNVVFLTTLFAFAWSRTLAQRVGLSILLLAAAGPVVLCLTRSVWLGLTVALIVVSSAERRLRRPVVVLLLFASIIGGVAYLVLDDHTDVVSERATDYKTVYIRLALYKAGLTMAAEQPLIGYGRHATELFQRQRARYVSSIGPIEAEYGMMAGPPHNAYLSNLLMYGVFGMILYISLFVQLLRSFLALRRVRVDAQLPPAAYAAMMIGIMIVYISISMFTDVMAFNFLTNLFFLLAGGAEGLRYRYREAHAADLQLASPAARMSTPGHE